MSWLYLSDSCVTLWVYNAKNKRDHHCKPVRLPPLCSVERCLLRWRNSFMWDALLCVLSWKGTCIILPEHTHVRVYAFYSGSSLKYYTNVLHTYPCTPGRKNI